MGTTHAFSQDLPAGSTGRAHALRATGSHRFLLALALALVGAMAVAPGSALALEGRSPESTFGSFSSAAGIAVDQSSGNVYVTDGEPDEEVQVFGPEGGSPLGGGPSSFTGAGTPSGAFSFSFEPAGLAVAAGTVYLPDVEHGVIDKFNLNGSHQYEFICEFSGFGASGPSCLGEPGSGSDFSEPLGVALDSAGDLYISDYGSAAIYEFNPAGEEIASFESGLLEQPQYIAVDSTGNIYAQGIFTHELIEFKRSSPTTATVEETTQIAEDVTGVAFDNATDRVLIDLGSSAEELNASDQVVAAFGSGVIESGTGIAVDETTGVVSVISNGAVQQFGPLALTPVATVCGASSLTATTATLQGTVDPEGIATTYQFEYGVSPSYGSLAPTPAASAGSASKAEPVSVTLAGLTPESTYDCRIKATNSASPPGEETGPSATFTTKPAVEGVKTSAASSVTSSGATLNGSLKPEGAAAEYFVEYGPTTSYGHSTAPAMSSSGTEVVVAESISGLIPASTYHFRLVAKRVIEGKTYETLGKDELFTTKPAVEGVKTSAASSVTGESATLNGSLKPEGTAAEYFFEYGPTESYGSSTTPATSSSGAEVQVSSPVTGLIPFTLYHFRLVAKRVIGGVPYTTVGQDQPLATLEGAVLIEAEQATGITPFVATLGGTVNPENSPASYYFEYGTTSVTEHLFVPPGLVSGYGTITIAPQTIQDLSPGTEYHYRLVAENAFGSVAGPEQTFRTLPASAPSIGGAAVSEVGQFGASVSASIDPQGLATNYEVELEIEGSTMPVTVASAGEGDEPIEIAYTLSSLAPGTAYQIRVVAWNAAGETGSQTQSFTTQTIPSDTLTQPLTPVLVPVPRITEAKEPALIKPTTKTLTRAQKLAKALKTCKAKPKSKRAACQKQARKKYAPPKKKGAKK